MPGARARAGCATVLSFLDCEKYPPSLLFLAMTLGPALCVLAWMDRPLGPWAARVAVYGRVPLFYYVLHVFLIHLIAIALAWPTLGAAAAARQFVVSGGLGYRAAGGVRALGRRRLLLYPACRWFATVKRRSQAAWMTTCEACCRARAVASPSSCRRWSAAPRGCGAAAPAPPVLGRRRAPGGAIASPRRRPARPTSDGSV